MICLREALQKGKMRNKATSIVEYTASGLLVKMFL